ncbi:hypothetical protein SRHO_G00120160 [Serrasalmus rhombeus]
MELRWDRAKTRWRIEDEGGQGRGRMQDERDQKGCGIADAERMHDESGREKRMLTLYVTSFMSVLEEITQLQSAQLSKRQSSSRDTNPAAPNDYQNASVTHLPETRHVLNSPAEVAHIQSRTSTSTSAAQSAMNLDAKVCRRCCAFAFFPRLF